MKYTSQQPNNCLQCSWNAIWPRWGHTAPQTTTEHIPQLPRAATWRLTPLPRRKPCLWGHGGLVGEASHFLVWQMGMRRHMSAWPHLGRQTSLEVLKWTLTHDSLLTSWCTCVYKWLCGTPLSFISLLACASYFPSTYTYRCSFET